MENVNFTTDNEPVETSICRPQEEQMDAMEDLIVVSYMICQYTSGDFDAPGVMELSELMVNRVIERSGELANASYARMLAEDPSCPPVDRAFHLNMFARGVEHAHQLLVTGLLLNSRGKQVQITGTTMKHLFGVSRLKDGGYNYVSTTVVNANTGVEYFGHNTVMDILKIHHVDNSVVHML